MLLRSSDQTNVRVADHPLEALAQALRTLGRLSGNLIPNGQFPHLDR
jgi:hypothetical protein